MDRLGGNERKPDRKNRARGYGTLHYLRFDDVLKRCCEGVVEVTISLAWHTEYVSAAFIST